MTVDMKQLEADMGNLCEDDVYDALHQIVAEGHMSFVDGIEAAAIDAYGHMGEGGQERPRRGH